MPLLAPRPQAETSAAGVARPSAHGQAMISTASPALNACSAGAPASSHPVRVAAAQASTAGTNTPQTRSASRWMAAFCACACSTSLISPASWVSRPTWTARTTSRPVSTTVPPVTLSPSAASPGTDSPVIMLRSMAVWPNSTSPSAAMVSPGRTTNLSPGRSWLAGIWRSVPFSSSRQTSLAAASARSRIAWPAMRRARASYSRPASRNVVTAAAVSR